MISKLVWLKFQYNQIPQKEKIDVKTYVERGIPNIIWKDKELTFMYNIFYGGGYDENDLT